LSWWTVHIRLCRVGSRIPGVDPSLGTWAVGEHGAQLPLRRDSARPARATARRRAILARRDGWLW